MSLGAGLLACGNGDDDDTSGSACDQLAKCCATLTDPTMKEACTSEQASQEMLAQQASAQAQEGCSEFLGQYCGGSAGTDGGTDGGGSQGDSAPATLSLGFTPSNVNLQGIDPSQLLDVDVQTTDCTLGGGNISCANAPLAKTIQQNSAAYGTTTVPLTVYFVKSFKVEANAVLRINDDNAVAIVALETIEIDGQVLANASAYHPGPGGAAGAGNGGTGGGGPHDVGGGQPLNGNNAAQGPSGASYCGVGGKGSAAGASTALPGGIAWGEATLIPLAGGSSGGGSGQLFGSASGAGGGALQLVAKTAVTIGAQGLLDVSGGGGSGDVCGGCGSSGSFAGGGGSGGAILLEAPTVAVQGTLAANGGGGGADVTSGADGTSTSAGAPATSGTGGSTPAVPTTGGAGSGGPTINGGDGMTTGATAFGGGGGGAGRIRINTTSGAATLSGTVTPATTTSCATQGMLLK